MTVLEQGAASGGARLRTWARALLTARSANGGGGVGGGRGGVE